MFFNSMFRAGASYNAINVARSALASVILLDNDKYSISNHPWICRYVKGVFNLRPPRPRYSFIWDVSKVLDFLRSTSPAHKLSLCALTQKVCMLLALLSAQRVQTIYYLTLDNTRISKDQVDIAVVDLLKHSRPGKVGVKLSLKAYPDDRRLCIVHYLREYIKRTQTVRGTEKGLFVTYKKPIRHASKQTIARWIKCVLKSSGIDTKVFSAHSTRSASTSTAKNNNFPLAEIMRQAGWSNETTFKNFYFRQTTAESSFGHAVVGTAHS